MEIIKILITGPFNSGKTTLINTLCRYTLSSDMRVSSIGEDQLKKTTTVALDYGIYYDSSYKLYLYGTPGQRRFRFMYDVLAKGMKGYIVLVDSSDIVSIINGKYILQYFKEKYPEVPYLIGANKMDLPSSNLSTVTNIFSGEADNIYPLSAINRDSAIKII
ncbi:MAG TPA: GTP-binding protein, partial [Thermoprotei archaeon]|nr:GTP-binding protein [Thermoprotei archaeon]